MPGIQSLFQSLFQPVKHLPAGIYHYQSPPSDPRNYRLHLRLEEDGTGILIINAATILHLNHTAAEYAYYLVQNVPAERAAQLMASRYQIDRQQAAKDYTAFIERILTLIETPDLDPVTFLGFDRYEPFSGSISAPYRLDCALTYRVSSAAISASPAEPAAEPVAPVDRVKRELSVEEWKLIIDKAWKAGVPHLVFTGGEPALREDLPALIAHAETRDQVTGLITDGLRLGDPAYAQELLQAGLDYVLIVLQEDDPQAWRALDVLLPEDIFVGVHLTLSQAPVTPPQETIEKLSQRGVKAVSLSAAPGADPAILAAGRGRAADLQLDLLWNLPVPYSHTNPVYFETQSAELKAGAGRAWLYVEPDGDVLPAQGINKVMGNLLSDPWEKIWRQARQ
mgnify:CR=1 FL=1